MSTKPYGTLTTPSRALRPRVPTEHESQCAVVEWAHLMSGKYPALNNLFAIPNGSYKSKASAARFQREGLKPGVPDLFLAAAVWDRSSGEWRTIHGLFIEMKREKGGTVSPEQDAWLCRLSGAGYRTRVCRGFEEARRAICEYLNIAA